jgi:cell division protein FtsN
MRYFVIVALIVAGVIFLHQQTTQKPAETPKKTAQVAAQPTLTPRPASEHDWAKAAIDRTNEVKQQVKRERASNEVP